MTKKQNIILQHREGKSNREIARNLSVDKNTVNKYVNEYDEQIRALQENDPSADPGELISAIIEKPSYDISSRSRRQSTEEAIKVIRQCLEENEKKRLNGQRKQEMRGTDIHYYLTHDCGMEISYSTVKRLKRELEDTTKEAYIRQEYIPGEICEFDWGEVKLNIGGTGYHKYQMAAFASAYGNNRYAVLFRSQDTAAFQESHVKFFRFCHGVYHTVVYDNMKVAVKEFVGPTEKEPTEALVQMSLYYRFNYRFCNVRRGNEKSHVERTVDVMRHFAFSAPGKDEFDTLEEANSYLLKKCIEKNNQKLSDGRIPSKTFLEEVPHLIPEQPAMPCFVKRSGCRVDKYSTAAVNNVRYSVPEKYVRKKVDARIFTNKVVFYYKEKQIAEHTRYFEQGSYHLDIFHYMKTLKKKPGALPKSTALLQSDTLVKKIYEKYYSTDPKMFLQILEIINEQGAVFVYTALLELVKISPTDLSADKLKVVMGSLAKERAAIHNSGEESLDAKIKTTLLQYDRLRDAMNDEGGIAV